MVFCSCLRMEVSEVGGLQLADSCKCISVNYERKRWADGLTWICWHLTLK